jgi:hypothetical protein
MREGFEKVNGRIDEFRSEVVMGLRKVAKQIDVRNGSLLEINTELRLTDDRLTKLEPQPAP